MKTIKIIMALALMLTCSANANAQFGGLLNKVKQKVKDKVEQKVDRTIDKALDGAEKKADDTVKGAVKSNASDENQAEQGEEGKNVQTGGNRSDFVPGAVVLFEDNLAGEQIGEFPSKWDLYDGSAEVATVNGVKAIYMPNDANEVIIRPLVKQKSYLGDEFTLEFDWWLQKEEDNAIEIIFTEEDNFDSPKLTNIRLWTGFGGEVTVDYLAQNGDRRDSESKIDKFIQWNNWNHIAVSFNKRALKVYFNGTRVNNLPNVKVGQAFRLFATIWGGYHNDYRYLTNFRLGKGAVALYDRNTTDVSAVEKAMAETGKFVTNNILFDTGKATLKPESMAEIQKVADYMKKNPSVRFEVQGHTDNQGSDKINDPLSQQRAESVVKALEGLGVDGFNLRAVGKGSHEPVADNSTADGRAKNRRVEFIKK